MTVPAFDRSSDESVLDGDLRIGDFIVRPTLKTVRPISGSTISSEPTRLPDKAMAVLLVLAENHRRVCERDDLLDQVWGEEREAYDRVLDNAIREIRRAFGDDARDPTYIQTIAKRGYRLIADVEGDLVAHLAREAVIDVAAGGDPVETTDEPRRAPAKDSARTRRRRLGLALSAALLVVTVVSGWKLLGPRPTMLDVALEIDPEGAPSIASALSASSLRTTLAEELVQRHPCGSDNLIRIVRFHEWSDQVVRVALTENEDEGRVEASVQPAGAPPFRIEIDLAPDGMEELRRSIAMDLGVALDRQICMQEDFDSRRRACHCQAAVRRATPFLRVNESLPFLERAVELDPARIEAYQALVAAYLYAGKREVAKERLQAGLDLVDDPESNGALVLRMLLARTHRDHREEASALEELTARNPTEFLWHLARAEYLLTHERGCREAREILEFFEPPDDDRWTRLLVLRALVCGELDPALARLDAAVSSAPKSLWTRQWLAILQTRTGRYAEAMESAQAALALDPAGAVTFFVLARIEDSRGAYTASDVWFDRAIESSVWPHEEAYIRVDQAICVLRRGEPRTALALLAEVEFDLLIEDLRPRWAVALAELALGDLAAAQAHLEEMKSRTKPRGSLEQERYVRHLEGKISAEQGDWEGAAAALEDALRLGPNERARFLRDLAEIHRLAGQPEQEAAAYERIFAFNPNDPWALCRMSELDAARGDTDAAFERARRALEVFGDPPEDPLGVECKARLERLVSERGSMES